MKKLALDHVLLITLMLSVAILFSACEDEDDNLDDVEPAEVSYVSLYHGSPQAGDVDVIIGNNLLNSTAFEYTEYTGYLRFFSGDRYFEFTPYNASNTLEDTVIFLQEDELYSIFLANDSLNSYELLITDDNIPDYTLDESVVRVVHLSPDAPEVQLSFDEAERNDAFVNVGSISATEFVAFPSGNASFDLETTDGVNLATVTNAYFAPERVYTIIIRGYINPPSGNAQNLSVQIVNNFY